MMKKTLFAGIAALGMLSATASAALAEWKPSGPIKLIIAFKAGGGADTQGRLIAEHIEKTRGWKVIPENVTGKGGVNALSALKDQPADGTAIGILVTESLGYNMAAAKKSGLKPSDFTPLATTAGFQMGLVAKTDKGWKSIDDVVAAAKAGQKIRFGAMSPRLADLAYLLGKAKGIEFNTVMVRGGKGVMNGLNAGDIDIGFGAGIQNKAVAAGDMINLASGMSTRLKISPDAPTLKELGVASLGRQWRLKGDDVCGLEILLKCLGEEVVEEDNKPLLFPPGLTNTELGIRVTCSPKFWCCCCP